MFGLGPQEILIIAVLGVLFFGKNLPNIGHSLGKTIVAFRNALTGHEDPGADGLERQEPLPPHRPQPLIPAVPKFDEKPNAAVSASAP